MHPSSSRSRAISAAITITLLFIVYFTLLPFVTVGSSVLIDSLDEAGYEQRKPVLGSRPPRCINKCLACKPCLPTLVAQGHGVMKISSSRATDDRYYLLAWRCRCGNKIFQP